MDEPLKPGPLGVVIGVGHRGDGTGVLRRGEVATRSQQAGAESVGRRESDGLLLSAAVVHYATDAFGWTVCRVED